MKTQRSFCWPGLFLALILTLLIAGSVHAQESLDTTLARSAVRGFFSSLSLEGQNVSALATFYLADSLADSPTVTELIDSPVTSYDILNGQWLDDGRYQVAVQLSPGEQRVLTLVEKVNSRWRIVDMTLGSSTVVEDAAADSATATDDGDSAGAGDSTGSTNSNETVSGTTAPMPAGEAFGTAEVLSSALNVRAGPGLDYAITQRLSNGDTVDVLGISGLGSWYQVAQNGQIIGWMSVRPDLVGLTPADADLPIISATPENIVGAAIAETGTGSTSTAATPSGLSSGPGGLVIQAQSGGMFYLVDLTANTLQPLTSGIDPAFSPDGRQIAFTRWDGAEIGSVWVYDLATGTERAIVGDIRYEPKSPTWSPDGSQLMVNFQQGGLRQERNVCQGLGASVPWNATDFDIEVSDSGIPELCFRLLADTHWKLRLIDVATGNYQDMASARYSFAPTWDPANPWRVVFEAREGLQQLDINRDVVFPFGQDENFRDEAPIFAPDGSQVALTYQQDNFWEVYSIDAQTGQRTRLTEAPILQERYSSAAPAWSPDSSQIVFITDRSGPWEFWIMNADGSNQRPLLPASLAQQLDVQYHNVDERLATWR